MLSFTIKQVKIKVKVKAKILKLHHLLINQLIIKIRITQKIYHLCCSKYGKSKDFFVVPFFCCSNDSQLFSVVISNNFPFSILRLVFFYFCLFAFLFVLLWWAGKRIINWPFVRFFVVALVILLPFAFGASHQRLWKGKRNTD